MKKIQMSGLVSAIVLFAGLINASAQSANEVLQEVDKVLYSAKDQQNKVTIILNDKNGRESTRKADVIQKGNDMRLFRFTAPTAQAGIAFLSLPKDVHLYARLW